jgi:hypothetical protein
LVLYQIILSEDDEPFAAAPKSTRSQNVLLKNELKINTLMFINTFFSKVDSEQDQVYLEQDQLDCEQDQIDCEQDQIDCEQADIFGT